MRAHVTDPVPVLSSVMAGGLLFFGTLVWHYGHARLGPWIWPFVVLAVSAASVFTGMAVRYVYVEVYRFQRRLRDPRLDAKLCARGLHRCVPVCRRGCCWACVRPGCPSGLPESA